MIAIAIGVVALAEMVIQLEDHIQGQQAGARAEHRAADNRVSGDEWRRVTRPILSGTVIGTGIGVLPGLGLAMGIPGSVIAAILAAGFTMHGIIPGPMIMRDSPEFMLGLFGSMLLASPLMLLIGLVAMRLFIQVITISFPYLFAGVIFFVAILFLALTAIVIAKITWRTVGRIKQSPNAS